MTGPSVEFTVDQTVSTIYLEVQERRGYWTVKFGKDNSPSSMMDHLRIHHQDEFNTVVLPNRKGVSLTTFNV
jgi:hypothetical protein